MPPSQINGLRLRAWLWLLLCFWQLLGGCAGLQQGPPIDAAALALPKVVEEAQKKSSTPAPPPPPLPQTRGGFRLWRVGHVTPNGDVYEGHYVEVSEKTPPKEVLQPDYTIPKAPKVMTRPAPKSAAGSGVIHRPPAPAPPAVVPGGMVPGTPRPQEGLHEPVQP